MRFSEIVRLSKLKPPPQGLVTNDVGGDNDSIPALLKSFSFAQLPATGKEFMRVFKAAIKRRAT